MQPFKQRPRDAAAEQLETYILQHHLQPGNRLPAERTLCELWNVNRSTLRSALKKMEQDGRLITKTGSGTFVAQPKFSRDLQDLHSLSWTAAEQHRTISNRLLSIKKTECDKSLARQFGKTLGFAVYKVARLRSVDGEPLMVETAYIPAVRAPGLDCEDLESSSLFDILEQYGMLPLRGDEKIGITYATAEEAELLDVPEEAALFWLVSRTYDQNGELRE